MSLRACPACGELHDPDRTCAKPPASAPVSAAEIASAVKPGPNAGKHEVLYARSPYAVPHRMSEAELRKLALDIIEGRVLHSRFLEKQDPSMMTSVFMLLALTTFDPDHVRQWGLVYEYLDQASPMGVNGWPIFMSMRLVHVEDMPALARYTDEASRLREQFLKPA